MKVTIDSSRLQEGLKKVSGVSDGRASVQILGNVLLEAKGGLLRLTATNLDITLGAAVECTVAEEGSTTVPMRKFEQVVSVLPAGEVDLSTGANERLTVRAGAIRMSVVGMPADQFPARKQLADNKVEASLRVGGLRSLLKKTAYAMSRDDTRKTLDSVLVEMQDGELTAVATDGRRLALAKVPIDEKAVKGAFIVPDAGVVALRKFISTIEDALTFTADSSMVEFADQKSGRFISLRLIDAVYPNYQVVIPPENTLDENPVTIDRALFVEALTRVSIMVSSSTPSVKLSFGENTLSLDVTGDEECNAHETVPIKHDGQPVKKILNPKYLLDVLGGCDSDTVYLRFTQNGPIVITAETDIFKAVVMPLREQ